MKQDVSVRVHAIFENPNLPLNQGNEVAAEASYQQTNLS